MTTGTKSFLDNLSIAKKTVILIIVITIGTLIIAGTAHFGVKNMKNSYDSFFVTSFSTIEKLESTRKSYITDMSIPIVERKNFKDLAKFKKEGFRKWKEFLESYYKNIDKKDETIQALVDLSQKEILETNTIIDNSLAVLKNSGEKEFISIAYNSLRTRLSSLDLMLSKLMQYYYNNAKKTHEKNTKLFNSTQYMVMGLTALVAMISLFLSMLIAKNFHKLIQNLSEVVEKTNKENIKIQKSIIDKVDNAVKEAREKDQIMYQNARLASMGEMIGNIAHQWRQPLNALTLLIQSFGTKSLTGNLNQKFIDTQVDEGLRLAVSMSNTIEDFRNFFSSHREKEYFDLKKSIADTLDMSSFFCKDENIDIKVEADEEIRLFGYSNEFSQVLLNLINNARENFKHRDIEENKKFIITLKKDSNGEIVVDFIDNGGGVDESIIDRIFEPYFTTKHKSIGTGIGLYMSKQIIETQMNGKIEVKNITKVINDTEYKCAKFTITFPSV